jgi:hypothetical protein
MVQNAQAGGGLKPNIQSPAAICEYAQNAGFEGADLITAVAIALLESGGNANAYNPELLAQARNGAPDGQGSMGLWQIYLFEHPEFAAENLYDPQTNANAAHHVYEVAGNSFSPWSTLEVLNAGGPSAKAAFSQAQSAVDDDSGDDESV